MCLAVVSSCMPLVRRPFSGITDRAGSFVVGVVDSFEVIPICWNLAPAGLPCGHEVPELVRVAGAARELAAHADDGNGLARPLAVGVHAVEIT